MNSVIHSLLAGFIDYAGLFPPASLSMKEAIESFASYRVSNESWMLSRFILPVDRLNEFVSSASNLQNTEKSSFPWLLTALPAQDVMQDVAAIHEFNANWPGVWRIDTIEMKASTVEEVKQSSIQIPEDWQVYFEIPLTTDLRAMVNAIRGVGRRAKIRTGGIREDMIPSSPQVAAFLESCVKEKVPFKATAGLHHPIRAREKLTYESGGPTGTMHGFLNVFLAAALFQMGATHSDVIPLLEEKDPGSFIIRGGEIQWRTWVITEQTIRTLRNEIASGFGSCSFREPVDDLNELSMM